MWALRRISHPLKSRGLSVKTFRAGCAKSEVATCLDDKAVAGDVSQVILSECISLKEFYGTIHGSPNSFLGRCMFSSQVGAKSNGHDEDDLEDGFSELESPASVDVIEKGIAEEQSEHELISEPDLSEEDEDVGVQEHQNELELSRNEANGTEKISPQRRASSGIFKAIIDAPGLSVESALDKWIKEGNELTKSEIYLAMLNLRKRRMYGRALQLSECVESTKQVDFVERDYASRLDLIAKVRGLYKAEAYIEKIPKSFRGEVIYRTLLANCVINANVKKAEEVFNKMKDLGFPITPFACNQLLLLYKRIDKKKIADVLLLMEKESVKPTLFTYNLLIDTKGQSNDISGMDKIFETMKDEGVEPNLRTQALLAKHYVFGGLKEKAVAVLKVMEGDNIKELRRASRILLPLYAGLGKADEVGRIWKACEHNPSLDECLAAIDAWGKLKKIEEAETVFDGMRQRWKKLSSRHYSALLKVYADHKLLAKGKDLVKQMADSDCQIGPLTWDAIIKLYVVAGEVEKADSILQKAAQQNQMKPLFNSYMVIMEQYANRGDIHNSEKLFFRMRQAGYVSRLRQFQTLMQAYINAKAPAYGIKERMKADNIFPNKGLAAQLVQVDAFRKTAVSDLLD